MSAIQMLTQQTVEALAFTLTLTLKLQVVQRLGLLMTLGNTGTSGAGLKATLGRFKEAAARRCSLKGPKAAARAEKREKRRSRLVPRLAY